MIIPASLHARRVSRGVGVAVEPTEAGVSTEAAASRKCQVCRALAAPTTLAN